MQLVLPLPLWLLLPRACELSQSAVVSYMHLLLLVMRPLLQQHPPLPLQLLV
jgi:hypothetical protein